MGAAETRVLWCAAMASEVEEGRRLADEGCTVEGSDNGGQGLSRTNPVKQIQISREQQQRLRPHAIFYAADGHAVGFFHGCAALRQDTQMLQVHGMNEWLDDDGDDDGGRESESVLSETKQELMKLMKLNSLLTRATDSSPLQRQMPLRCSLSEHRSSARAQLETRNPRQRTNPDNHLLFTFLSRLRSR